MSEASWFRRWYWLGIPPVSGFIGYWLGTLSIPNWIVALGIAALTLSVSGVMYWSNQRWINQQRAILAELARSTQNEHTEYRIAKGRQTAISNSEHEPFDPRVFEQLWRTAQNIGLVSETDATAAIARNQESNE